jgi:hypothetical protein
MFDALGEMRKESEKDGGGTYITFSKNRNGNAGVKFGYQLSNNTIDYGTIINEVDNEEED